MLNPKIPQPQSDFIDARTGKMSREWYRYFYALYNETSNLIDAEAGSLVEREPVSNSVIESLIRKIDELESELKIMRSAMVPNSVVVEIQAQMEMMKWH